MSEQSFLTFSDVSILRDLDNIPKQRHFTLLCKVNVICVVATPWMVAGTRAWIPHILIKCFSLVSSA